MHSKMKNSHAQVSSGFELVRSNRIVLMFQVVFLPNEFWGVRMWVLNIMRNLFLMMTPLVTLMLMIMMILNLSYGLNEPSPQ